MIRAGASLAVFLALTYGVAGQPLPGHGFETDRPGRRPSGFEFAALRQDGPGTWLVRRDGSNQALVHERNAAATGFSLALAPDAPLRDVELSVRMRFAGEARRAGLVWRYVNDGDYYAATLDLVNGRVSLFRVAAGNRVVLESEDGLELDSAAWHTLKVVHAEARVAVSLGGIRVFEERDRRSGAGVAGRSGVIAAGDAEAWFDDLRIEPARPRRREPK